MRRTIWTMAFVGAMVVTAVFAGPRQAQAGPGFFSLSIGAPGYYGSGYPGYAPYAGNVGYPGVGYGSYPSYGGYPGPGYAAYPGVAPSVPQPYVYASVPFGVGLGYGGPRYGAYYSGGFYPHGGYGHHGYGHHHYH